MTDGQPASLSGIKHPSGAYDQILITLRQLRVCWFGAPSLTRGRVCRLQLLLALASAVIFGSEYCRTRGHILLSQIRDFPFCRLLRLTGSRWRYSTPPLRVSATLLLWSLYIFNFSLNRIINTDALILIVYSFRRHDNFDFSLTWVSWSHSE
jgi:hypothetical protein